jgi:copper chaperone CopZ
VRSALENVIGVLKVAIDTETATITFSYDPQKAAAEKIIRALNLKGGKD